MLQCTTGARKRGPSAINVLGNSHSHLLTNGTAGSNPEMFPCCFHHDSESWWSRHLMLFQLDFGCIASKDTVVKEKPAWFWYLQTSIVWRNECDREQGEGGMDWAGWNQEQEHPELGTLFPQLCSPPPVQSTMWIQHNQSCHRGLPSAFIFLLPCLCKCPAYRCANARFRQLYIWTRNTHEILRFYKESIMLRRPRNDLNNFPLARTLKFEVLFSQKNFSSVRKRKIKETIQWTHNEEQLA